MKRMHAFAVLALAVSLVLGVAGCKNDAMTPTTLDEMGGMEGVTKLVAGWTGAMSANETLSKSLTADDMNLVGRGFATEVAKASKVPSENSGVDLVQVLQSKNLSKENLTAMRDALQAAAGTNRLSPEATKGALGLWDGVVKQVK
jgi:hypothetical protein